MHVHPPLPRITRYVSSILWGEGQPHISVKLARRPQCVLRNTAIDSLLVAAATPLA